jgi:dTDP-glucose 4,6-dehydratase
MGSALVRRLVLESGWQVVNVDKLTYAASPEALKSVRQHSAYSFEQADICDAAELQRLFQHHQPNVVIHMAAESHVDRSIDGPAKFIQTNIVGTYTLLDAALAYWRELPDSPPGLKPFADRPVSVMDKATSLLQDFSPAHHPVRHSLGEEGSLGQGGTSRLQDFPTKSGFRFLHVSTDEVYGALSSEGEFHEISPYRPNSPYSASKASSDLLVRAWNQTYGLPTLQTNSSNNYGPWQHDEKLIPRMVSRALAGETLPVFGTGKQVRDWIHVDDHACAVTQVLLHGQLGETYNIGANCELENLEIVRIICETLDDLIKEKPNGITSFSEMIQHVDDRQGHDFRYALNTDKIRNELGWSPQIDFTTGLRGTIQFLVQSLA